VIAGISEREKKIFYSKTKREGKAEICCRHYRVKPVLSPLFSKVCLNCNFHLFPNNCHIKIGLML
jgi:hypothetical protein